MPLGELYTASRVSKRSIIPPKMYIFTRKSLTYLRTTHEYIRTGSTQRAVELLGLLEVVVSSICKILVLIGLVSTKCCTKVILCILMFTNDDEAIC
jgi:hypothetical protein